MNNLEFFRLLTNLKIVDFIPTKSFQLASLLYLFLESHGSNFMLRFLYVEIGNLKLTKACKLE